MLQSSLPLARAGGGTGSDFCVVMVLFLVQIPWLTGWASHFYIVYHTRLVLAFIKAGCTCGLHLLSYCFVVLCVVCWPLTH